MAILGKLSSKENAYQEFFKDKLKKYKVKSPEELSEENKTKFFAEIKEEWGGETSSSEVEKTPTKLPPRLDKKGKKRVKRAELPNSGKPKEEKAPTISVKASGCVGFQCNLSTKAFEHKAKVIPYHTKDMVKMTFSAEDWVFTQSTIIASTIIEDEYRVAPIAAKFVNGNGNGISNELLKKYHKSFIGAHNYKDHIQEPKKSKGVVIDSVLRKVSLGSGDKFVYYNDILVATNRVENPEWAKAIEDGKIKFMSMGCYSTALRCSMCGNIAVNQTDLCDHVLEGSGYNYIDSKGQKRIIANLITDDPNEEGERGINFFEASYLSVNPAFRGASLGYVIKVPEGESVSVQIPKAYAKKEAFKRWASYIK